MKRWLTAAIALAVSGAVSAALLIASNPSRDAVGVLAAAQDVPAGTTLFPGSIAVVRINATVSRALLFSPGDQAALTGLRTTHNLLSGQLIQRSDVTVSPGDRRLVFLPLKDVPAVAPGSHVDLLLITGPTAQPSVQVFATGVEVRDSTSAGLVVVVAAD
ncbi:MAG TPA: SAF domain-containing protein, partial [Solirubrobacteraceae bacterium]